MNSQEYRESWEHMRSCMLCKFPISQTSKLKQYRPHTGDKTCWCLASTSLDICEIDRGYWRDLPKVEYI